jgi:hypothetical protein
LSDTGSSGLPPAANSDFTQNAVLVGGAAALLALAAFLGYAICHIGGPPEMKTIAVTIDKSCTSKLGAKQTSVQKDRDILVWRIESECATAQNVLICVTPDNGAPPLRCWGDPDAAKFGTPFPIDDKAKSYIICALKWPQTGSYKYDVELRTGATNTTLTCQNKDYELALEVVP